MSNNFYPLVSIVIPVYNGSDYLAAAIDSALAQTYQNIEVLIVDDGSCDDGATNKIAQSYGSSVRYFHKENGGVASALNLGVTEMRGEYFSWLSHDDLYAKNKIALQLAALEKEQDRNQLVYSDSLSFSNVDSLGDIPIHAGGVSGMESMRYLITTCNSLHGCSFLIPKYAFETCGSFNESLRYVQDYEMWFRIAGSFPFIYIQKPLVFGRRHPNQTGNQFKEDAQTEIDLVRAMFFHSLTNSDFGRNGSEISCKDVIPILEFAIKKKYPTLTKSILSFPGCNKFLTSHMNSIILKSKS